MNYNENIDLSLADFEKSICFAALIFDKRILPYSPRGGIQMFRKALAPAGTYAPSFKYIFLICLVLGALCTVAWCSGSGSVPSETAEPIYGAQSSGCVFIKALQSKVFSEILLICVNFLVTAHGFTNARAGKMLLRVIGHKKYYGRRDRLCERSLSDKVIEIRKA